MVGALPVHHLHFPDKTLPYHGRRRTGSIRCRGSLDEPLPSIALRTADPYPGLQRPGEINSNADPDKADPPLLRRALIHHHQFSGQAGDALKRCRPPRALLKVEATSPKRGQTELKCVTGRIVAATISLPTLDQ